MALVLNELLLEGITVEELQKLHPSLDKGRVDRLKLSGMPLEDDEFTALNAFNNFLKDVAKATGSFVPMAHVTKDIFDAYLADPANAAALVDHLREDSSQDNS